VRSQTGSTTNPWQFTGQQLDAESSLYFLRVPNHHLASR